MPDVNVLVYAHRRDEPSHAAYRAWQEQVVDGDEPFALSTLVAVAFVRIVTNRRIYGDPTPLGVALSTVEALIDQPSCRVVAPGPRHFALVASLCRATKASGKAVADAQHAAVAIESGCTLATRDGDFAAFARHGLRWKHLAL
jgi:toxin-antitoxin system PIN domain toxin